MAPSGIAGSALAGRLAGSLAVAPIFLINPPWALLGHLAAFSGSDAHILRKDFGGPLQGQRARVYLYVI